MRKIILAFLLCLAPTPGQAQSTTPTAGDLLGKIILAHAVAIDGDSLLLTGPTKGQDLPPGIVAGQTRIRLWGILAPDLAAPGGWQAMGALDDLLRFQGRSDENIVQCLLLSIPATTKQTIVGRCAGPDLQPLANRLVSDGWAVAFRHFTWARSDDREIARTIDELQRRARVEKRGLWGAVFLF